MKYGTSVTFATRTKALSMAAQWGQSMYILPYAHGVRIVIVQGYSYCGDH